ncbi:MAG: DUF2911 domain-containing protein [Acidobacteria bacterium]|nr:DUF2911 domain-containing protein [Acidobacteriota bacterium]
MKKNSCLTRRLLAAAVALLSFASISFSQTVNTPRPVSPAAELSQTIGLSRIVVNYSRPKLTLQGTDRTGKIWGQLVPYGFSKTNFGGQGDIPWRAGANENTTIEFSDDVKIEGKPLAAGKYGLHMLIYEDDRATLIFSKNNTSWGSFWYDAKDDVMRVDVKTRKIPKTEVLTYSFIDYGTDHAVLALSWEMKQIPFRIEFDTNKVVVNSFRNELRSLPGFGWQGFLTAANYCLTNNVNLDEALSWADTAATRNPAFNTFATKGAILYQLGRAEEGDKVYAQAIPFGNKNQVNAAGYQLLGLKRYAKAIEFFKMNAEKYSDDPNVFDSLGEAYKQAGDRENAIKNLKKALSMDPPANVKANSEKLLKELGSN